MRGEHPSVRHVRWDVRGSSPRARGALFDDGVARLDRGIIPACAGSTISVLPIFSLPWDHPRVRGEHPYRVETIGEQTGSSPRARGAPGLRAHGPGILADHPRVRGEHTLRQKTDACHGGSSPRARGALERFDRHTQAGRGSSPRARGALYAKHVIQANKGIIPACAGSTHQKRVDDDQRGDHPRVRGEHILGALALATCWGSSPRARGAHRVSLLGTPSLGIIPACAGSTRIGPQRAGRPGDHPRVRGEHIPGHCLSPRPDWIIPACAGSTHPYRARSRVRRDHPRVRGEHMHMGLG